jgi:hypothetical protein
MSYLAMYDEKMRRERQTKVNKSLRAEMEEFLVQFDLARTLRQKT